jgi:tricorn protease
MHETGYYRFATIAGNAIVFVCEDDLWTVPAGGKLAEDESVTLHEFQNAAEEHSRRVQLFS